MKRSNNIVRTEARYVDYQGQIFLDRDGNPAKGDSQIGDTIFRFKDGYLDGSGEPAIETTDGHLEFWHKGYLHKDDGPAIISGYGKVCEYWKGGIRVANPVSTDQDVSVSKDEE